MGGVDHALAGIDVVVREPEPPGHHTLTESGAQVVASLLGIGRSELRYVVRDEEDRAQDSYLAHRIGVNEFFCALIEAGRANDGHGLAKWVPERTVGTATGWIRPDGYGVFLHPLGALDFYLEYDRGTETTRQLANRLAGLHRGGRGVDRAGRRALSPCPYCVNQGGPSEMGPQPQGA